MGCRIVFVTIMVVLFSENLGRCKKSLCRRSVEGSRAIINIRELIANLEEILKKIDSFSLRDQDEGTQMLRDKIAALTNQKD